MVSGRIEHQVGSLGVEEGGGVVGVTGLLPNDTKSHDVRSCFRLVSGEREEKETGGDPNGVLDDVDLKSRPFPLVCQVSFVQDSERDG